MGKEQELLNAARNGQVDVVEKILMLRHKKTNSLASLRKAPSINIQDTCGYTCLHYAALNGHKDVVRLLLQLNANVNLVDNKGCSCLHLSAWAGHYDIVNYILMQSNIQPNVNLLNIDDETALHCAAQFGHSSVCTLLIKHGADITIRNIKEETPFDLACEYGRFETVDSFLKLRPDLIHSSIYVTHSPLHLAAKNGHRQIVKLLLNLNFDVNSLTENGTALHEAVFYGKVDVVRTLLDYGINTALVNQQGKNVFDLLSQLNTNVSRTIEKIIESHTFNNQQINQSHSPLSHLNKSTSLNCILPPKKYCDKNQKNSLINEPLHLNSELVAYAAEASQFTACDLNKDYSDFTIDYVQPPQEFAQQCCSSFYLDQHPSLIESNKFNSSHRPKKKKILPMNCENKLKNNFSKSQDSIMGDYILSEFNQKTKPKQLPLSTFVDNSDNNFSNLYNKYQMNQDEIYTSLDNDEPIYSYPTTIDEPLSLENNYSSSHYKDQINTAKYFNKPNIYSSENSLSNFSNNQMIKQKKNYSNKPNPPIKPPRKFSSINSVNSSFSTNEKSYDSGYVICNNQKIDYDQNLNCNSLNYSTINQNKLNSSLMRRSTSNASDSYLDGMSASYSSKELNSLPVTINSNYSTLNRYSSYTDEIKINSKQTVQRIKVNSNDLYAQIDKKKKNSLNNKVNSLVHLHDNLIQSKKNSNEFYDQPSKLVKPVQTDKISKQFEIYSEIEKKQIVTKQIQNEKPINDLIEQDLKKKLSSSKLYRDKRATIAITLNENNNNDFETKPPSPKIAASSILKILKPIRENYEKLKLNPSKQNFTDEKILNKLNLKNKGFILKRNLDDKKAMIDRNTCTSDDNDIKIKEQNIIDKKLIENKINELKKQENLIDLDDLKKLEDRFNEMKTNKDTLNSNKSSMRRPAPPPPPPIHQSKSTLEKSKENKTNENNLKEKKLNLIENKSDLPEKVLENLDKNLSKNEKILLNKPLNLNLNLDWKHDPLVLYKQTCHYLAFYLGSTKIKSEKSTVSSQKCIQDYKNLVNQNKLSNLSMVILSISYKNVRCVDINCQKILSEHEIRTVHYACQDMDQFRFFAFVTKDSTDKSFLNCHVFSTCNLELTNEILTTLAQAFEIAFRIASGETIDQLRKYFVKNKLNQNNNLPSPPPRHSSFSLERNCSLNYSKSLSESQFNQLIICASNNNSLKTKNKLEKNSLKSKPLSASKSLKSLNFESKNKLTNLTSKPQKPIKPNKPVLKHQTSLPENSIKLNILNKINASNIPMTKPIIPMKPSFKR